MYKLNLQNPNPHPPSTPRRTPPAGCRFRACAFAPFHLSGLAFARGVAAIAFRGCVPIGTATPTPRLPHKNPNKTKPAKNLSHTPKAERYSLHPSHWRFSLLAGHLEAGVVIERDCQRSAIIAGSGTLGRARTPHGLASPSRESPRKSRAMRASLGGRAAYRSETPPATAPSEQRSHGARVDARRCFARSSAPLGTNPAHPSAPRLLVSPEAPRAGRMAFFPAADCRLPLAALPSCAGLP